MLLALPWVAAAGPSPAQATLHAAIAEQLEAQQLTGAVWATVRLDGAIAVDAAGLAHAPQGVPLVAEARVHVGSIAKTLLATGVLRMISEGRLALDTPVSELLPGLAFDNPWAPRTPVRLRHLLDHTSGLDDARFSQIFSLRPKADAPLAEAFAGREPLRVRSRPGSRHSYSNTGYTVLGMVIEAVTGTRYEAWLDRELLAPLGMRDSTFAFTTQAGDSADPRLAMGHFEHGVAQAAVPMYLRPAAQFTTTAADMARYARFLMGDGSVDGSAFIDVDLLQAMGEPAGTEAATAGLRVGYGLGLARRDRHGAVGKCHGGNTVGYRAMLCIFPAEQRAFFIAVNADSEDADYGQFDRLLVRALEVDAPVAAPATPAPLMVAAPWQGYYVPAPNRFASMALLDTTLGFVRVLGDGGKLRFAPFQTPAVALKPVGGALFQAPDRRIASHALLLAEDGTRVISTGLQSYVQTSLLALLPLWLSLVAGLLGLAWLLLAGGVRVVARRGAMSQPLLVPWLGVVALLLPLPLFYTQSFLALGDLTAASASLAAVTLLLPLTMLVGLARSVRQRPWSALARLDALAMLAVLLWTAVLAGWGLLPLRLWH